MVGNKQLRMLTTTTAAEVAALVKVGAAAASTVAAARAWAHMKRKAAPRGAEALRTTTPFSSRDAPSATVSKELLLLL